MQRAKTMYLLCIIAAMVGGCKEVKKTTQAITEQAEEAEIKKRDPQVIVDESLAIDAHGWQARGFSIPEFRPVQVVVTGVKDTDKGFNVYLMQSSELANYKAESEFRHIPGFRGAKTNRFSHTEELPGGQWTLVVANTENILRGMVVNVKITVDPE